MFAKLARSWQFAKISYGIIWDFKRLLIFPVLSTLACVAVLASFAAPLWLTGTLETKPPSELFQMVAIIAIAAGALFFILSPWMKRLAGGIQ